jgi:hypothetical protein
MRNWFTSLNGTILLSDITLLISVGVLIIYNQLQGVLRWETTGSN